MKQKICVLALATLLSLPLQAVWRNSGEMNFTDSKMDLPEFENKGLLACAGNNVIKIEKLTGNGTIHVKSGKTIIQAREFLFNGVIESQGECTIYTLTPESQINVTKKGSGTVTVKPRLEDKKG